MTLASVPVILAVDLGKTSCRVRVTRAGQILAEAAGAGAPGLADHDGAAMSANAIAATLTALRATADGANALKQVTHLGVGAAGAAAAPAAAAALAVLLRAELDVPVAVLTDALAAHAGAFGGSAGTVLITGTGAVVFSVQASGLVLQVDGWGPWLGDDGSGRWIGQRGLHAALSAHDGRGPHTALLADAQALTGDLATLPIWVTETDAPARRLGSFAPTVLHRAAEGDAVAVGIVDEASRLLAATCAAAGQPEVSFAGGLGSSDYFAHRLTDALAASGLHRVTPRGDPLSGAALVATTLALPYERWITRG